MAAPVEIEDANWHRSKQLHKECGWKHGDSAIVNLEKDAKNFLASRCAAISNYCCLTSAAFSWIARENKVARAADAAGWVMSAG